MSITRLRPTGRSFACWLLAAGLLAAPSAFANDDAPEDAETQAESNDSRGSRASSNEDEESDEPASKSGEDSAKEEADAEQSEPEAADESGKSATASDDAPVAPAAPVEAAKPSKPNLKPAAVEKTETANPERAATPVIPEVPAASTPADQSAVGSAQSAATPPSAPTHDVYSEHTDQKLKSETAKSEDKVHPLQLRYPDQNVVVCTAGCGPGGTVVHKRAKTERRVAETAVMVPSAANANSLPAADASSDLMTCVAGCFTTPRTLRMLDKRADLVAVTNTGKAEQQSSAQTASPAALADQLSGKWLAAPERNDGQVRAPAGQSPPAGSQQMGSGDWMKRINGDRQGGPVEPN